MDATRTPQQSNWGAFGLHLQSCYILAILLYIPYIFLPELISWWNLYNSHHACDTQNYHQRPSRISCFGLAIMGVTCFPYSLTLSHRPVRRNVKLWVAHVPGIPVTFPPPSTSKETASSRSRHASRHVRDARAVMHVGIANLRWRGKRSRHSRRMRNLQCYLSDRRSMVVTVESFGVRGQIGKLGCIQSNIVQHSSM